MEYRNPGNATHHGTGLITNVISDPGIELVGSTILPASDSAAAGLTVRAKGTGTLQLGDSSNTVRVGGSTSAFGGMNRGTSTMTLVELPASALVYSTVTVPGVGVNDMIFMERPGSTLMSTALGMVGYSCTAANEVKIAFLNNLASTASILADTPIKFAYIKA